MKGDGTWVGVCRRDRGFTSFSSSLRVDRTWVFLFLGSPCRSCIRREE